MARKVIKKIDYFTLVLMALVLAACSSDSFKIEGNIANLNGLPVRVVFQGDSSIVDEQVELDKKGRFSFKGSSAKPVIVSLLNHNNETLAMVVAANGDHIKVKGDATKAVAIKVKGNKVNEGWQMFRDEHAAFYTDSNPSRLNAAIEKYVREHPDDMLSTVLLMADYSDYSDRDKVDNMLKAIELQARPESLITSFRATSRGAKGSHYPRLMNLTLFKHGGDFEEIDLKGRVNLLSMWANPPKGRENTNRQLADFVEHFQGAIHVIDILTESDTLRWHQTIADDPKTWPHYWAPGGPLEQGLQLLGVNTMPWYAVTDSTGLVVYSGPNLADAKKKANETIVAVKGQ